MQMVDIQVEVEFKGTVTVKVPKRLSKSKQKLLAEKLTIAQILATEENPDCGECLESACEEFVEAGGTEKDFDASCIIGVGGTWTNGVEQ